MIGDFDGLPECDLEGYINGPKDMAKIATSVAPLFETCPKCKGSGQFYSYSGRLLGACHACKGKGKKQFKLSAEKRAAGRARRADRKINRAQEALDTFKTAHPVIWQWMDGSTFPFAVSLREAVTKWGHLTDNQLAAAQRCVDKLATAKVASAERITNAVTIDMTHIEAAFAAASKALKSPKLRVAGFIISPAKVSSRNAGSLYVKGLHPDTRENLASSNAGEMVYLGRITGGKFVRSRECDDVAETRLLTVAADPLAAAVAYGQMTGCCACCGRELTKKESIARGIGPICAGQFGWGA